ncbi:MAG: carbon-nitrogen hydrolase [Gammaproteobacteria bacterium]|nr:carbon-nitrogen hydrolase [Gammaproteobacteria bacterium]MDH5801077.1 carbon-nitrogen hydrolase [Gammaproteobacteria bacterium]
MTQELNVALIQQACLTPQDANMKQIVTAIREAAAAKAQLVVLQELHNTPYFCQTENPDFFDLAESVPGPSTRLLGDLAKELKLVIVASLFEKRAAGLYHNTAVVIETNGEIAGRYRKMHIPDDPGYYEKYYFTPGDLGFEPIQTSVAKLGILVCWDQWYPEAARLMALAGAELLIYPTAIGWDSADSEEEQQRQKEAWMTIQRGHAIANGLHVIAVNRTGHEPDPSKQSDGIQFWGSSFVAGPQGELLTRCSEDKSCVQTCTLNLARTETVRRSWPYFRDRRTDSYHDIIKRYRDT